MWGVGLLASPGLVTVLTRVCMETRYSLGEVYFSPFERINAKARRRKECSMPVGWHASGPPPHTHQSAGLCPQGKHFLQASWCIRNSLIESWGIQVKNGFPGEGVLPKHWRVWQGGATITFVPPVGDEQVSPPGAFLFRFLVPCKAVMPATCLVMQSFGSDSRCVRPFFLAGQNGFTQSYCIDKIEPRG